MAKFKAGDLVQFTLEEAIKLEMCNIDDGPITDPLNEVYEIVGIMETNIAVNAEDGKVKCFGKNDGKVRYHMKRVDGAPEFISGAHEEDLIKVEGEPRHIEKTIEKRPTKDEYYLGIAKQIATRSTCLRRKYGAVIVRNDVIVSTGYNGSPRGERNCSDRGYCMRQILGAAHNDGNYGASCRASHAEMNAIINAARQGSSIYGATLYLHGYDCNEKKVINAEPCPICARMIANTGIVDIVASKEEN